MLPNNTGEYGEVSTFLAKVIEGYTFFQTAFLTVSALIKFILYILEIMPNNDDDDVTPPVRSEFHLVTLAGHELWDEGEVWDLSGCPAELEDDDEGGEVDDLSPLRSVVVTGQAGVEDEGERYNNTNSSWEMERELL